MTLTPFVCWVKAGCNLLPIGALSFLLTVSADSNAASNFFPEASDPVLGGRAAISEWAWSPAYAKRFGQLVQPDGLKDGPLWLVGVKIQRQQSGDKQLYTCRIVGIMNNKLPFLAPSSESYMTTPGYSWFGGLPGKPSLLPSPEGLREYTPAQTVWYKQPHNQLEKDRPERNSTIPYLLFLKNFMSDLAYFELEGGCGYFNNPEQFRNEIRFPIAKPNNSNGTTAFKPSAIKFDLPDSLMRRIYPYTVEADDWSSCLMRRTGDKSNLLTLHAIKSKRFGNACEPAIATR